MAKQKSIFVCNSCGRSASQWFGKCPSCGQWGTCIEEFAYKTEKATPLVHTLSPSAHAPIAINDITTTEEPRINLNNGELNRVLGGGLVKGSLVLIGGEPGIGKSTLILQTMLHLTDNTVLYVSGEESSRQLKFVPIGFRSKCSNWHCVCPICLLLI